MENELKRIVLFVGNYGSGKTEIALETAFKFARCQKTALVDLDIVNPYFRSAEHLQSLQNAGIRVIMPSFALTTVDVPSLPPDIMSVFDMTHERVIFDVGGDEVGAVALGQYAERFEDYDMLFVVNARRPLSSTPDDICALIERVEGRSGLRCTGLVNNTNLANESTANDLIFGERILNEVSVRTGLPVRYTFGKEDVLSKYANNTMTATRLVQLEIRMRREWMDV